MNILVRALIVWILIILIMLVVVLRTIIKIKSAGKGGKKDK